MDDLQPVFNQLRAMLVEYSPPFTSKNDSPGNFDLYSIKQITTLGRNYSEMYFAGAVIRKGYVGLYFMPVYTHPALKDSLDPALLKLLKGKSCFHIKQIDAGLAEKINSALRLGCECYQELGWV